MKIQPYGNRILVKPQEASTKKGNIYLPDSEKEKKSIGEVIEVSTDIQSIKKGETVIYGKYSGDELEEGNQKYVLLDKDDILAKVV